MLNTCILQRAQGQNEKLGTMLEDLYDSERKLSKLLEQYEDRGAFYEVTELRIIIH